MTLSASDFILTKNLSNKVQDGITSYAAIVLKESVF